MSPIRSFVIRIYRRDRSGVAGTVEDVRGGSARAFHSLAELWAALSAPRRRAAPAPAPAPAADPPPPPAAAPTIEDSP